MMGYMIQEMELMEKNHNKILDAVTTKCLNTNGTDFFHTKATKSIPSVADSLHRSNNTLQASQIKEISHFHASPNPKQAISDTKAEKCTQSAIPASSIAMPKFSWDYSEISSGLANVGDVVQDEPKSPIKNDSDIFSGPLHGTVSPDITPEETSVLKRKSSFEESDTFDSDSSITSRSVYQCNMTSQSFPLSLDPNQENYVPITTLLPCHLFKSKVKPNSADLVDRNQTPLLAPSGCVQERKAKKRTKRAKRTVSNNSSKQKRRSNSYWIHKACQNELSKEKYNLRVEDGVTLASI